MDLVHDSKKTDDIRKELTEAPDLNEYLSENQAYFSSESVQELLNELYQKTDLTKAELARRSGDDVRVRRARPGDQGAVVGDREVDLVGDGIGEGLGHQFVVLCIIVIIGSLVKRHRADGDIDRLSGAGLVRGYGDGTLGAADNLTVEQVKMLTAQIVQRRSAAAGR